MATLELALDPVYRNRSGGTGTDKIGKMLVDLGKSLESAWLQSVADGTNTGWRRHGAGDGRSLVSTTLDANIWTGGSSGDGYKTSGTAWSAGDGANSWSNPDAWQRWVWWKNGVATTLEMIAKRMTSTSAGQEQLINWGITTTGFSGVPTATSPYPTGSYQSLGANLGVAHAWGGASGLNMASLIAGGAQIGATNSLSWHIWRDVGARGFAIVCYDSSNDRGCGVFLLEYGEYAAADTQPWIVGGGTWANLFGGDGSTNWTTGGNLVSPTAIVNVYAFNGGAWFSPRQEVITTPAGGTSPPGVLGQTAQDLDGNYSLIPLVVNLDNYPSGITWTRKGIIRDCYTVIPGNLAHEFPLRVQPTNGRSKLWVVLGNLALPWPAEVSPSWNGGAPAVASNWRIWPAPGVPEDLVAPTVTITPATGSTVAASDSFAISATDADSDLADLVVSFTYSNPARTETAFSGGVAVSPYSGTLTQTTSKSWSIAALSRTGGLPGSGTITAAAVDKAGNRQSTSNAFTVSGATLGTITPSPASGGALAPAGTLSVALQATAGIASVVVLAAYASGARDTVFANGVFQAPYTGTLTQTSATSWTLSNIQRTNGWAGSLTTTIVLLDKLGNATVATPSYTVTGSGSSATPSPASGTEIEPTDTLDLVVAATAGIASVTAHVTYSTGGTPHTETVFANGAFQAPYSGTLVQTSASSWTLQDVGRDPGWPGDVALLLEVTDSRGVVTHLSASYPVTAFLPTVSLT